MNKRIRIENTEYEAEMLSEKGRTLVNLISWAEKSLSERNNLVQVLSKAKNAYIDDLKAEVIKARTGVDFSDF